MDLCESKISRNIQVLNLDIMFILHISIRVTICMFTGTVALWLEENAISKIANLGHMKNLRCLFLQTNAIKKIEGLHDLIQLRTLNLSNNMLSRIENLSSLSQLHTLELSRNLFSSVEDIAHLVYYFHIFHILPCSLSCATESVPWCQVRCTSVNVLDLSHNRLSDPRIVAVLEAMPALRVLYLLGNSVTTAISDAWGRYLLAFLMILIAFVTVGDTATCADS
jgi:dynein assembly factor 1, axonemal